MTGLQDAQTPNVRFHALSAQLAAASDRSEFGPILNELAMLAPTYAPALQLLLATIVERSLAEVSIRKVFFDEDLVDDGVQETVLAVAGGIDGFRGDASFLTWLDRVALNVARQIKRRGRRLSEPVSNDVPDVAAWALRVSSVVADEIVVSTAFSELNSEHQQIIGLREMEDLSYEQIAERLGINVGTVRSRLSRARAELAERLVTMQRSR